MLEDKKKRPMLSASGRLMYGAGIAAHHAFSMSYSLAAMFSCVKSSFNTLTMGLAIAFGLIASVAAMPFVAFLCERVKAGSFYKRHITLLFSLALLPLVNLVFFSIGENSAPLVFLRVFATMIAVETLSNLYIISAMALGDELCGDNFERHAVYEIRQAATYFGISVAAVCFALVEKSVGGFIQMAYIISAFLALFGTILYLSSITHLPRLNAKENATKEEYVSLKEFYLKFLLNIKNSAKSKNYGGLFFVTFACMIGAVFLPFSMVYFFELDRFLSVAVLLILILAAVANEPLYKVSLAKTRLANLALLSAILLLTGFTLALITTAVRLWSSDYNIFWMLCLSAAVCGAGMGGIITLKRHNYLKKIDEVPREQRPRLGRQIFLMQLLFSRFGLAVCFVAASVLLNALIVFDPHASGAPIAGAAAITVFALLACVVCIVTGATFFLRFKMSRPRVHIIRNAPAKVKDGTTKEGITKEGITKEGTTKEGITKDGITKEG